MTQKRRSIAFAQNTVKQPPAPSKPYKLPPQSLVNSENEKENLLSATWDGFLLPRTLWLFGFIMYCRLGVSCISYTGARGQKVIEPVQVYLVVKLKLDFAGLGVR